jgi:hypothetical protein
MGRHQAGGVLFFVITPLCDWHILVVPRIEHWYWGVPCTLRGAGGWVRKRLYGWLLLVLLAGAVLGVWISISLPVQQAVRPYLRAWERHRVLTGLVGYQQKRSQHFDLYYTDSDANVATLILETAERVWAPVSAEMVAQPRNRVPLILYPSRDDLRQAFGWGQSESALGVYWQGTIRLLSPNVWLDEMKDQHAVEEFERLNPIAHELTHYILDERTGGNYPRWFTEALAQQVEERVTGYLWLEPNARIRQSLYDYRDLSETFQTLPNQPLAYRQSYLFLRWLAGRSGEATVEQLIQGLAKGRPFPDAFASVYGGPPDQLFGEWQAWALANVADVDEPRAE